jgi:hypothetical protein
VTKQQIRAEHNEIQNKYSEGHRKAKDAKRSMEMAAVDVNAY